MRILAISSLALAFCLGASAVVTPPTLDPRLEKGTAAFKAYDLATARQIYQEVCDPAPADPFTAALCEHDLAAVADAQGKAVEAEARYRQADRLWKPLDAQYAHWHAGTLMNLGEIYRAQHRSADAEATLARALQLASSGDPALSAAIQVRLGGVYTETNKATEGRLLLQTALATLGKLSPANLPEQAFALDFLGMIDLRAASYPAAEANFRRAVALSTQALGEDHPETASFQTSLALALYMEGKYARAATLLRRTRYVIETRMGPDSAQLATAFSELSAIETAEGKFTLAENDGRRALEIMSRRHPANSVEVILCQVNLARVYLRAHKTAEAEKLLPEAVEAERRIVEDRRVLAEGIRRLAELRSQQKLWAESGALYREAISLYEAGLGASHPEIAAVLFDYAQVLKHRNGAGPEIKSLLSRAKSIAVSAPPA